LNRSTYYIAKYQNIYSQVNLNLLDTLSKCDISAASPGGIRVMLCLESWNFQDRGFATTGMLEFWNIGMVGLENQNENNCCDSNKL